ncbi:hypothetical protein BD560DRAFT_486572 [Blakeslea trispora]|nr:hypothetical protein BD560DRAFT_486572 [Blakeslea trispora]
MFAQSHYNQATASMPTTSPAMNTPYLDSSFDTPFLDNHSSADTPPFFDTLSEISPYLMYASFGLPNFNNMNMYTSNNKDDICATYLDNYHAENDIAKLAHNPLKFNGDPNVLLLDKSKASTSSTHIQAVPTKKPSPTIKLEAVTEEGSDSLFPPLNSSQQSINTEAHLEDVTWDKILGFDASSPLSESLDSDSDLYQEDEEAAVSSKPESSSKAGTPVKEESSSQPQESKKRKATSSSNNETNKRKKTDIKNTKRSAKKPKEAKLYYCHLCDHVSKRRYNLGTHIKTHDKSRVKEFGCPQCNKAFDRRHDRDRHLATVHRGERSYACSHCATHFSRRDALNRHLVQKHDYNEYDLIE